MNNDRKKPHISGTRELASVTMLALILLAGSQVHAQRLASGVDPAKRDWYGEFYDLKEYARCVEKTNDTRNTQCEYLRLTRVEEPEYWPYPNTPRPKLPEASNPPVYKSGMTSKQYFDALCKAEAGEFIYKVVENVEGVYQIRPRKKASQEALFDRYVMEDPYGYTNEEATEPWFIFVGPKRYAFLEAPAEAAGFPDTSRQYRDASLFTSPPRGARFAKHGGYDGRNLNSLKRSYESDLKSQYGFLWRGIVRPHDRELGIVGGELAVVDLKTGDLLGLRRGFIVSGSSRGTRSGIRWEVGAVCPANSVAPGLHKSDDFAFSFVSKVLKPANR